jgi:zinc protease
MPSREKGHFARWRGPLLRAARVGKTIGPSHGRWYEESVMALRTIRRAGCIVRTFAGLALLAGCLLPCRLARAQPIDPFSLPSETIRLPNGLKVLLAPDPRARFASVVVSYAAGSADDPDGLRGLAHMVEHLVANRTKHVPDTMRALEAAGGCRFNATTTPDATTYFESVPPERLATALWIESDRMGFAEDAITEERVDSQRAIVENEERQSNHDGSLAALGSITMHELFPAWHPYAALADGATDTPRVRAKDVLAFIHTWYTPANATLAIAGAFDRQATVDAIIRYFGHLPSAPVPTRPVLPTWVSPGAWLLVDAAAPGDSVVFAWRTPAYGSKDDAALDLAAAALAGAGNERLTPALIASHLATGVSARQQSEREASVFYLRVWTAPGVDLDRVVRTTQAVIDEFARSATADETARAQAMWRSDALSTLETTWGRASLLTSASKIGDEPGPTFDWGTGRRSALDQRDVARTVGERLGPWQRVVTAIIANRRASIRGVLVRRDVVTR